MSRNAAPEQLWLHSREPIRQPLLKKLLGNPDLSNKACLAFTDILQLHFILDISSHQSHLPTGPILQLTEEQMLSGYVKAKIIHC